MPPVLQRAVEHSDMTEELADILSTWAVEVKYRIECDKYATSERIATASAAAVPVGVFSGWQPEPEMEVNPYPPPKCMFRRARRDSPVRSGCNLPVFQPTMVQRGMN